MTDASVRDRTWRYTAIDRSGRRISDLVTAADVRIAARKLSSEGLTPIGIVEERTKGPVTRDRNLTSAERVLVLRQLALMLNAGVPLLEAVQTIAEGIEARKGQVQFEGVIASLRSGVSFGDALEKNAPGFPVYLYAMARVGEATGKIGDVLNDAAEQMAYSDRLRNELINALTYPGFLLGAGLLSVVFIFTQVVPRFAVMIGDRRSTLPFSSRAILDVGEWSNGHIVPLGVGAVVIGVLTAIGLTNSEVRLAIYRIGLRIPVVGVLLRAGEISSWARLTGFALANGVLLLEALSLSRLATPLGPFRAALALVEADLRAGVTLEASLARHTTLKGMDLSLLRAGARSGTLPRMFSFLAEGYDNELRDTMKRLTALVEPIAIGFISILVGTVALSLILALSSIYQNVL